MKRSVCVDPELEQRILLEIGLRTAQGRSADLPPDLLEHLAKCESCRSLVPSWAEKGSATHQLIRAQEVVRLGRLNDPSVRSRPFASGTGYYLPSTGGSGLFVVAGDASPFDIRRIEEMTTATFEALPEFDG
jgi:hypothetical protein